MYKDYEKWFNANRETIEEMIEQNYNDFINGEDDYISFSYEGIAIANPLLDETGMTSLSFKESIEHYGRENIISYMEKLTAKKSV